MNLDFHKFRETIRAALLRVRSLAEGGEDPFVSAWFAYALSCEELQGNALLGQIKDTLVRWCEGPDVSQFQRNLGPLALLAYLLRGFGDTAGAHRIADTVLKAIRAISSDNKFSPLRDPEQVFLIALGLSQAWEVSDQQNLTFLLDTVETQIKGPAKRRLLYAAALRELGREVHPQIQIDSGDPVDLLATLWWSERYQPALRAAAWQSFATIHEQLALAAGEEAEATAQRVLSVPELALLYESVIRETRNPDPLLLFEIYPLHPRIRAVAEASFRKGEYRDSVEHATKVLNDLLRARSGLKAGETELIRLALGDPASNPVKNPNSKFNPIIRFNPLDSAAPDYESQVNEQRGLSYLGYAVFAAFRHPRAHQPKDDPYWGTISAQRALDELVIISYLTKRIEAA